MQTLNAAAREDGGACFLEVDVATASAKQRVLSFSHDLALMMSRQWLLERNGYEVRTAMNQPEFRDLVCRERIDLAVFCQTLTAEECETSGFFLAENSPTTRCLVLFAQNLTCPIANDYVLLDANRGPAEFVSTVSRMLPQTNA